MLVIKKQIKRDELVKGRRIFIGDNIILTVVRIDGQRVSIGIEAPPGVAISDDRLLDDEKIAEIERNARRKA